MINKFVLILAIGAGWAPTANACGKLSLSAIGISQNWSRTPEVLPQDLQVTRSNPSKPCTFFITFTGGQSHSHLKRTLKLRGSQLGYQVYRAPFRDEGQILKSYPGPVQFGNVVTGNFLSGQSGSQQKLTYYFGMDVDANPLQFPPSGVYTDSFTVNIYQGNPGQTSIPDATAQVFVRVFVPKMIALSLVPTGSAFRFGDRTESMNFGILKTGESKDFDMLVITNSGYSIRFSSLNNGVLSHIQKEVPSKVPYQLQVDSSAKNLIGSRGHPVVVAQGGSHSHSQEVQHRVQVTIGDTQKKVAGQYQDIITIFATTSE